MVRVEPLSKLLFEFFFKIVFFKVGWDNLCGVVDFLPRSVEDVFGRGHLLMHDVSFLLQNLCSFFLVMVFGGGSLTAHEVGRGIVGSEGEFLILFEFLCKRLGGSEIGFRTLVVSPWVLIGCLTAPSLAGKSTHFFYLSLQKFASLGSFAFNFFRWAVQTILGIGVGRFGRGLSE